MKIIRTIDEMKAWSRRTRREGIVLGLVPTMGYLHEGHLRLVRESLNTCDRTVVSIFVNPKQFRPNEDLESYPRNLETDREKLERLGVDVLFAPSEGEMYPEGYKTYVNVEEITDHLCGKSRPGFFRGVTTIVLKLFHIIQPDRAFFGEKDRQQLEVIRKMVRDLNLDVQIAKLPIIREPDGLAMSSRNQYLEADDRKSALALHQALEHARRLVEEGESSARKIRSEVREIIEKQDQARVDYISVCDPEKFEELERIQGEAVVALAVHIGKARLIDNCLIERV